MASLGNDTLDGGTGDDTLDGGADNDCILGGDGRDRIITGPGNDIAFGDADEDIFITENGFGDDTIAGGEGVATGADFDRLDLTAVTTDISGTLSGFESGTLSSGTDSVTFTEIEAVDLGSGDDNVDGSTATSMLFVDGRGGADTLTGGSSAVNFLSGGSGNDLLVAGSGAANLIGGTGADTIVGGAGDDTLRGEEDGDRFVIGDLSGSDTVAGGEAITTGSDIDTLDLSGDSNNQTVTFNVDDAEAGTITDGTDSVSFSQIEQVVLGAGDDTIDASAVSTPGTGVLIFAGAGDDVVRGSAGDDSITGGTGSDTLIGGAGDDLLRSSAGNDVIVVTDGSGSDTITDFDIGDADLDGFTNDQLDVSALTDADGNPVNTGDVVVTDTNGDGTGDAILTFPNGESITLQGVLASQVDGTAELMSIGIPPNPDGVVDGTAGADMMTVDGYTDADGDQIDGADGDNDVIQGNGGNDTIFARDGDDTVFGGTGQDEILGLAGNDYLDGGDEGDTLDGGVGDDTLIGGAGADTLLGNGGSDRLVGGAGDVLVGGNDADTIVIDTAVTDGLGGFTSGITVDGGTDGIDADTLDLTAYSFYTNLTQTPDGDGDSTSGTVDVIDGLGNTVTVSFTEIETLLLPPIAPDFIVEGSAGDDLIDAAYLGDPEGDRVDNLDHSDGSNRDSIEAGDGNDTILSGLDADSINAGAGDDSVLSGDGDDVVDAAGGADTVSGGSGNDFISGEDGDDQILGGSGDDSLFGRSGDDTFLLANGFGNDIIEGGEIGEVSGDMLDASTVTANLVLDLTAGLPDNPEDGTLSDGVDLITFSEIETILLGLGNDTVSGSGVGDNVDAGDGADVIDGGGGDDTLTGGAGDDTFILSDGDGADIIADFDMLDTDGDGFTNDRLDVSGLTDAGGDPVNAWDVVVTDTNGDGTGDAILIFPNGEQITLQGVSRSEVDTAPELISMGVPCYTPGTLIDTPRGPVAVEELRAGDLVHVAGGISMPVIWAGASHYNADDLARHPNLRPVRIPPGLFGNVADLVVSQQHCMVIDTLSGPAFVRAKHLAEELRLAQVIEDAGSLAYHHILLPRHAIIIANGALSESFYPGRNALKMLSRSKLIGLAHVLSGRRYGNGFYGPSALPSVSRRDVQNGAITGFQPDLRCFHDLQEAG